MEEKLNELKQTMSTLADLGHALAVMGWDQETYMPPGGLETRGNALATISKMAQEIGTDEKVGKLIEALEPWAAEQDPDSDEAREFQESLDKAAGMLSLFAEE